MGGAAGAAGGRGGHAAALMAGFGNAAFLHGYNSYSIALGASRAVQGGKFGFGAEEGEEAHTPI